jgi:hypothetical protein
MTSCINDVNSAARFGEQTIGEQTKRAARKPPSSPANLQRDAHRGDIAASFRGLAPTPLKADRRSYNATVVSQWSRALTSSTTVQIRANKKGGFGRPLACTSRRTYAAPATLRSSCRTAGASLCSRWARNLAKHPELKPNPHLFLLGRMRASLTATRLRCGLRWRTSDDDAYLYEMRRGL